MTAGRALSGVRVLDLTRHVAGPYCTKLLAGLGAEVIKVEPPEETQASSQPRDGLYIHLNTGKKSVRLDLRKPEARPAFLALAEQSDILVESLGPGTLERLGFDQMALRAVNPRLVLTSITNFGQTGPYRDFAATEIVFMAVGGFMYLTGDPDQEPVQLGGLQSQYQAGLQAALGTLAALYRRGLTSSAEFVDVSIAETVASLAAQNGAGTAYVRKETPKRSGNRLIGGVPTAHYPSTTLRCKDGYAHVHGKGWDFEALSVLIQQPRLAEDEIRLAQRGHADEIDALLSPWLMARTKMQVLMDAQEQFVPFCAVLTIDEVLSDPQHAAQGFFVPFQDPERGAVRVPGPPFRLHGMLSVITPPPLPGEHTEAVLSTVHSGASLANAHAGETPPASAPRWVKGRRPGGQTENGHTSPLPLTGVRVLDLTQVVAGPYATQILADLGADVVKVESHTRYDQIRGRAHLASEPEARDYNRAFNFNNLNRNKRGLCLNLNTASGKTLLRRLVTLSDVLIENFSPRVMRNFGLDYPVLKELNPGIVMVSMPGFGSNGPYQNFVSHGPGIDAMSGLQSITGYPDGPPLKAGGSYTDQTTGTNAAVAVLAALQHRNHTGQGLRVEVAMREAITAMIGEYFVDYGLTGQLPARWGNRSPRYAPQGCYRCAGEDRWVAISIHSDGEWQRLCRVIGRPELGPDRRYASLADRHAHHDAIDDIITSWTSRLTHLDAMAALQAAGLAAGAVLTPHELVTDPHMVERHQFETGSHPEGGETLYWHNGFQLGTDPLPVRMPAPRFGEHTRPILHDLVGLSSEEFDHLYRDNVIADAPVS